MTVSRSLQPQDVHLSSVTAGYCQGKELPPELPAEARSSSVLWAVRRLWNSLNLDPDRHGAVDWNPLGEWIRPGQRVLIKPNWVRDRHLGGDSLESLITHTSLIEAVLHYVIKARPGSVVVGDAPIQGCDFRRLLRNAGVDALQRRFADRGSPFRVLDLRCVILPGREAWSSQQPGDRAPSDYLLFDLGQDSRLEEITTSHSDFRVTMYDPESLRRTHDVGRHQYLVAREVIEADVVLNLPKLKTHKKAGLTGAVKNIVGINGHKEYLPHHRKGSCAEGGDCYRDSSVLKRCAEFSLDRMNSAHNPVVGRFWSRSVWGALTLHRLLGGEGGVEGSWHGNDTIWRTCLDLQRILRDGRIDGSIADQPQRQVLHLTDAVVAGEGEGPMMTEPVPLGLLTFGANAAAADWVHAWLMGFDPRKIPLVREAFSGRPGVLAHFRPESISVWMDGQRLEFDEIARRWPYTFRAGGLARTLRATGRVACPGRGTTSRLSGRGVVRGRCKGRVLSMDGEVG